MILAQLFTLVEAGKLRDKGSIALYGSKRYIVDMSCRVPEGRHYEGANIVGAFGAQLAQYVKLARADA